MSNRSARASVSGRRTEMARPVADRPIVPIYLRQMGATSLLSKAEEIELARQLEEARKALALLAVNLPSRCRRYVLNGNPEGPLRGGDWLLDQVEEFYMRLLRYAAEHEEPKVTNLLPEAKRGKRRLDRARDTLILANLRLVIHIAKRYANQGVALMDLIQEGNIGLMKAVERFRYKRGYKFSTYAYWWIKQAIDRAIADKARLIRVPVHVKDKLAKIARVSKELNERSGRKPTPEEVADGVGLPLHKVEAMQNLVQDPIAFEDFGQAGESNGLLPLVAA